MAAKSSSKKRQPQNQSQKSRKKRKTEKHMIFYGFECPHCPEDEESDSQVRWVIF